MILGQRAHLELKIDYEEWLPSEFDDINRMLHRWGLANEPQEVGWVLAADADRRIRCLLEVARGTHRSLEVHIPSMLAGILTTGADRWAFIHNHPSGDPTPSGADLAMMEHFREISALCGIYLEDGIIVTTDVERSHSMLISGDYTPKVYGEGDSDEPDVLVNARLEGQISVHP